MASVTQRIAEIKQPRLGYLPVHNLEIQQLEDNKLILNSDENIPPVVVGLAVDYLTRFMHTRNISKSFTIPLLSLDILRKSDQPNKENLVKEGIKYLNSIKGLDNESIIYACKLASIDYIFRTGYFPPVMFTDINPDLITIEHIKELTNRTLNFFSNDNQIIKHGMTFEGGYTDKVTSGDADFMTSDTLWDLKVSKSEPTSKYTLQLAMYWRLGLHSTNPEPYRKLRFLGIYNPRLNKVYRYDLLKISDNTIEDIDFDVIGYNSKMLKSKQNKPSIDTNNSKLFDILKASEKSFVKNTSLNDSDLNLLSTLQSESEIKEVLYLVKQIYQLSAEIEDCLSKDRLKNEKYYYLFKVLRNIHPNNKEETKNKLLAFIKLYKEVFDIDK